MLEAQRIASLLKVEMHDTSSSPHRSSLATPRQILHDTTYYRTMVKTSKAPKQISKALPPRESERYTTLSHQTTPHHGTAFAISLGNCIGGDARRRQR